MTTQADYDIQHGLAMQAIGFAAQMLTPHADIFARLIAAEREMHSYLHITDSTLYRAAIHSDGLRQQVTLARAAIAFVTAAQEVKGEMEAEGEAQP